MVLVPLALAIILAGVDLQRRIEVLQTTDDVREQVGLIAALGDLVVALTRERGVRAAADADLESADALEAEARETDRALATARGRF